MNRVIITRGIPGAGKSTWIAKNLPEAEVVSADNYCLMPVGTKKLPTDVDVVVQGKHRVYRYDSQKARENHARCMKDFLVCLEGKCPQVVVDNTLIHQWEYMVYVPIAHYTGYQVEIHEFMPETLNELKLCVARNTHRVPADIIWRMAMEFESCDSAITHKII